VPGDLPPDDFRSAMHRVADLVADYLEQVGEYPVLPRVRPGEVRAALPASPPNQPEPIDRILDDYKRLIEPNVTHWNHPAFFAYFSITASGPGILGETLATALNVNSMLWHSSPAATELEELVCDWVRQMLALPEAFRGHINDTASMSSLLAVAAARHGLPGLEIRQRGMAGRPDLPPLALYISEHTHSSLDKAAIALGLGMESIRRIPVDADYRMDPKALATRITEDRAAGVLPLAIVATAGTTSTTSIDPLRAVAEVAHGEGVWYHIDAAYGGSAAICPEYRALMDGLETADSIVLNPHKWLFVPIDCSLLYLKDPDALKSAFSLVPEYLRTADEDQVTNLMDYGVQLGKRFRSLKLWMTLRTFGVEGMQERIREHCRLARAFADWVEASPDFEVCAPVPLSLVCFRAFPDGSLEDQNAFNERLLAAVNAEGSAMLSHTKLDGRYVLRLAIGNLKTTEAHLRRAWEVLQRCAQEIAGSPAPPR
jgi:aromatic-L-amino-acid/L-tryptophan decarboxylase